MKGGGVARGAALMVAFRMVDKSIGLISTLILARILTPADFGLVAMATAVLALTELMGAFGFDTALIQRQDSQKHHYNTAWTFNVLFGVAITIALLLLASPAADFYREPRLLEMLPVLALGALVGGFENIGTVAFRKELNFDMEFRFLLIKRLAAFVVTLSLAFAFRTYWALIIGIVTSKCVSVLISYRLHPYRPSFCLEAKAELMHFSKWLFISNLIQFLHSRSTDFILGRTVGTHGLGIYNIGVEIAVLPSTEFIAPINRAIYPVYSKLAVDLEALWARFFQVFGVICLVALPVSTGLICVAEVAVQVLLGNQWGEAVPIIRIIAVSGLAAALQSNLYLVILALGRPKANTLLSGCLLLISLPAIVYFSIQYGAVGAASTHCVVSLVGLSAISIVFTRITGLRLGQLGKCLLRPILASALMGMAVIACDASLQSFAPVLRLLLLIVVGIASYAAAVILLWAISGRPESSEKTLIDTVLDKISHWRQGSRL